MVVGVCGTKHDVSEAKEKLPPFFLFPPNKVIQLTNLIYFSSNESHKSGYLHNKCVALRYHQRREKNGFTFLYILFFI